MPLRSASDKALPNFGVVQDGQLFRGGLPGTFLESAGSDGYELLEREYQVRTIVDLTNEPIDRWIRGRQGDCARMPAALRRRVKYVAIPSVEWYPSREHLIEFLRVFQDPANRPVYLHCSAGENRTGAMIAGFRVIKQSWSTGDAKKEMRNYRVAAFWTLVNDRFIDDLAEDRDAVRDRISAANAPTPAVMSCDAR